MSQLDNLDFAGDASDEESDSDPDEFTGERYGDPSFADEMDSEDFDDEDATEDDDDDEDEDEDELLVLNGPMDGKRDAKAEREWRKQMLEGLEEGELDEIMADMARMKEGGAFDDDMDSQDGGDYLDDDDMDLEEEKEEAVKPVKAKKADKKEKKAKVPSFPTIEEPTPSFSSLPKKSKKTSSPKQSNADDALTEDTALSAPDSDAKSAARHSLRFHVSKIESAASRRASARSGRMGGDDDVPYRNKQAGRDAALRKNSAAGAANGDGDDLDGEEWGEADRRAAKEVREMDGMDMGGDDEDGEGGDAGEGDDGYYQLVKKRKRVEKEEKQAAYDEAREEERCVFLQRPTFSHALLTLLVLHQVCRRGRSQRTPIAHACHPEEQGSHSLAVQGRPKPPCQEAHAVRQSQEAGRVHAGRLQGWSERPYWKLRWRTDGNLAGCQESQVLDSFVVPLSCSFTLRFPPTPLCTSSCYLLLASTRSATARSST